TQGIISTRAKIAKTLLFEHKYAESEAYIKETMVMAKEAGTLLYLKDLHETLVNVYAKTGDFRKALEFQEILNQLKDSLLGLEENEYMAEIAAGYENERNEKELALLKKTQEINGLEMEKREQEELKQFIILGSFIVGTIIICVFLFLLIRRYRERKKTNLLLEKQNLEITIQKDRIQKQRDEIKKQRDEIEVQRDIATQQRDQIARQKQEITDSINYAERIQIAMLPPVEAIGTLPGDCFVLFLPRDIVSGDFYWIMERQNISYVAVADCTGHGVPGAFMSMLGISFLNEIISSSEYLNPVQIIELLRNKIQETFRNSGRDDKSATVLDGMDIALCAINTEKKSLDFAGANLSLYQMSGGKITEHPGEKIQISAGSNNSRMFILKTIDLLGDDCFYMMSDGFADQFGGKEGKKFKHSGVLALFESINSMNMAGQREKLEDAHRIWKGQYEQVDDILILGFKT
ncbi:MAG: SpoIIE family protein phosphatase, partial [Bacteroidota bacterium]